MARKTGKSSLSPTAAQLVEKLTLEILTTAIERLQEASPSSSAILDDLDDTIAQRLKIDKGMINWLIAKHLNKTVALMFGLKEVSALTGVVTALVGQNKQNRDLEKKVWAHIYAETLTRLEK